METCVNLHILFVHFHKNCKKIPIYLDGNLVIVIALSVPLLFPAAKLCCHHRNNFFFNFSALCLDYFTFMLNKLFTLLGCNNHESVQPGYLHVAQEDSLVCGQV